MLHKSNGNIKTPPYKTRHEDLSTWRNYTNNKTLLYKNVVYIINILDKIRNVVIATTKNNKLFQDKFGWGEMAKNYIHMKVTYIVVKLRFFI